ncbi:MAG: hypothetical protein ACRDVM_07890, partial [Acidimicrobiia bacterium]
QGSQVIEFEGLSACVQEDVVFLRFFGDQYANDPMGVLGTLRSVDGDGRVLTFARLDEIPEGAEPTGIHHDEREIYLTDEQEDYLYIEVGDTHVERWPRAEVPCEPE